MKMATKQEIIKKYVSAYLKGAKKEKSRILNLLEDVTGYERKALIRRCGTLRKKDAGSKKRRGRRRTYGADVTAALKDLWEYGYRICAERLQPILPEYIRLLKQELAWHHAEAATGLLLRASLATLKRRIAVFEKLGRRGGRGATRPSELKEIIPIRRGPWENPEPGYGEVDTVAHCGGSIAGDFCYTVQYTDVATIWTCLSGQWNKGEVETQKSIERIRGRLPFTLRGIDPDSGSEFINWHLKGWCDAEKIDMTRTRPYMKNDHARIEQKNYANIRSFVGYARFADPAQAKLLNELYDVLEDYVNFFIPSMKCMEKVKIRSRYVRKYDVAATAYARVLAEDRIEEAVKEKLRQKYATLKLVDLKKRLDALMQKLFKLAEKHNSGYGNTVK